MYPQTNIYTTCRKRQTTHLKHSQIQHYYQKEKIVLNLFEMPKSRIHFWPNYTLNMRITTKNQYPRVDLLV